MSVRLSPDFYKAKHKDIALLEIIRFTALKFKLLDKLYVRFGPKVCLRLFWHRLAVFALNRFYVLGFFQCPLSFHQGIMTLCRSIPSLPSVNPTRG